MALGLRFAGHFSYSRAARGLAVLARNVTVSYADRRIMPTRCAAESGFQAVDSVLPLARSA